MFQDFYLGGTLGEVDPADVDDGDNDMQINESNKSGFEDKYLETSYFDDGQAFTHSQFKMMNKEYQKQSRSNVLSPAMQFDNSMTQVPDTDITPREPHKNWAQPGFTPYRGQNSRYHRSEVNEQSILQSNESQPRLIQHQNKRFDQNLSSLTKSSKKTNTKSKVIFVSLKEFNKEDNREKN